MPSLSQYCDGFYQSNQWAESKTRKDVNYDGLALSIPPKYISRKEDSLPYTIGRAAERNQYLPEEEIVFFY